MWIEKDTLSPAVIRDKESLNTQTFFLVKLALFRKRGLDRVWYSWL